MIVLGVIGGVASGKSAVTESLRGLGASVLDADRIGHRVLRSPPISEQIRARWGEGVFSADGDVDRRALAEIVFDPGRSQELAALERMTHPEIENRIRAELGEASRRGVRVLVLDAPVMIKTGWYRLCDVLIFVECPRARRLEYAAARGWDEAMLDARDASQAPLERKRELATHLIRNDGTLEDLDGQVRQFWQDTIRPAMEA